MNEEMIAFVLLTVTILMSTVHATPIDVCEEFEYQGLQCVLRQCETEGGLIPVPEDPCCWTLWQPMDQYTCKFMICTKCTTG
ncbi:hypothetical protein HA402_004258 [Bradysia odoriphaga]|nr:hypothetical protein HA402_004258 [Bradysia odoriphaga]